MQVDGVALDLLAQFVSPKASYSTTAPYAARLINNIYFQSNKRDDIYSAKNALDIIQTIVWNIRERTSSTFIICIKLNASEYTSTADPSHSLSDLEQRAIGPYPDYGNLGPTRFH